MGLRISIGVLILAAIAGIAVLSESGSIPEPPQPPAPATVVIDPSASQSVEHGSTAAAIEKAFYSRSPLIGQVAPDFSLVDDQASVVRLSEFAGRWVVLYFYPPEDTPDCACAATAFTREVQQLGELPILCQMSDLAVLAIAPLTPQQQLTFRGKYALTVRLLCDPEAEVLRRYGAWASATIEDQSFGRAVRSTLVIGPEGRIRRHWPQVMPDGHVQRIADFLREQKQIADAPKASTSPPATAPGPESAADQVVH
jgi:peroxiredoxin Q/BCP